LSGEPSAVTVAKIDRDERFVESQAVTAGGEVYSCARLAHDGHTLAGNRGVALAWLWADGDWRRQLWLVRLGLFREFRSSWPVPTEGSTPV
jgi:hypothetical protein